MTIQTNQFSPDNKKSCDAGSFYPRRRATDISRSAQDVQSTAFSEGTSPGRAARPGRRRTDDANLDPYERRWRVVRYVLERDSAATILGALLLLSTFVFVACASLFEATVPDPVSNAFLLLLGYFFGHAGNSNAGGEK